MKTAIVIPARYASSRLPGKPLLRQTGKYLVQHVYEQASRARRANSVTVATDDPRIVAAVASFGGRAVMTRRDFDAVPAEAEIDAETVRALIRVRRLREQFFPRDLFADPAWDMLLDLMAARLEQSRVAVSSLCIAASMPATTALRWIRTLAEHNLFIRRQDPETSEFRALLRGSGLMVLAGLTPLLGWFLLAPAMLLLATGLGFRVLLMSRRETHSPASLFSPKPPEMEPLP